MKTKKINKLKMFNNLSRVMDNNKKIWSNVKEIEKAYKSFLDGTNKLNLLKDEYDKDLKGLIDRKLFARKNLIIEAFPIISVIKAFAIDNKQRKLIKKCNFSKAELRNARDLELVEYSKLIWKEAKKLYSNSIATPDNAKASQKTASINIHNYGLTGQMIDKLEIANVTLVEARLELRDAYAYKKNCRKKITSGIQKNNDILKNKLDLLMTIFKASDAGFYSDYNKTRSLSKIVENIKQKSENTNSQKKTEESSQKISKVDEPIEKEKNAKTIISPVKTNTVKKVVSKSTSATIPVIKSDETKPVVKRPPVKRPSRRKPVAKTVVVEKKEITNETPK
jgi:hypothetical protein